MLMTFLAFFGKRLPISKRPFEKKKKKKIAEKKKIFSVLQRELWLANCIPTFPSASYIYSLLKVSNEMTVCLRFCRKHLSTKSDFVERQKTSRDECGWITFDLYFFILLLFLFLFSLFFSTKSALSTGGPDRSEPFESFI